MKCDELVFTGGPRDGGVWPWTATGPEVFAIPEPLDAVTGSVIISGEYRRTEDHTKDGRRIYRWHPAEKKVPGA